MVWASAMCGTPWQLDPIPHSFATFFIFLNSNPIVPILLLVSFTLHVRCCMHGEAYYTQCYSCVTQWNFHGTCSTVHTSTVHVPSGNLGNSKDSISILPLCCGTAKTTRRQNFKYCNFAQTWWKNGSFFKQRVVLGERKRELLGDGPASLIRLFGYIIGIVSLVHVVHDRLQLGIHRNRRVAVIITAIIWPAILKTPFFHYHASRNYTESKNISFAT